MSKTEESAPQTGAQPPVSANAAPANTTPDTAATPPGTPTEGTLASAARKAAGKAVWMGTAVGIGSAAIVAALLYTSKKRG